MDELTPQAEAALKAIHSVISAPSKKTTKPRFIYEDGEPHNGVPTKRQVRLERTRYSGEKLREIRRAGGGAKEQMRAMWRRVDGWQATRSSGNVFLDLGFAPEEAEQLLIESDRRANQEAAE